MGTRGRKSSNDINVVRTTSVGRLPPPAALTEIQKIEWMRIINDFPADYFNSGQVAMLKQYVKHVVTADVVSGWIDKLMIDEGEFTMQRYDRLLKMQERETRALASLGIRLGFAKSAYRGQGAKTRSTRKPWE